MTGKVHSIIRSYGATEAARVIVAQIIEPLQAQLATAKEEAKAGRELWIEAQTARKRLRLALDTEQEKNKRLREAMDEIEAVACGETQIESDGTYDDSDGMKWIYDRVQALKE